MARSGSYRHAASHGIYDRPHRLVWHFHLAVALSIGHHPVLAALAVILSRSNPREVAQDVVIGIPVEVGTFSAGRSLPDECL
jgi:hypothetical protein